MRNILYDPYVFHKFRMISPQNVTFLCDLLAQRLIIMICTYYVK